ncbi:hypothetical protein KEM56_005451 [Ascosphaera pollenicola]|nr:hypothetical protein KEM56_005451 [Ascosphaera pollenicola]
MGPAFNLKSSGRESHETARSEDSPMSDEEKPAHLTAKYLGTKRDKEEMIALGKKQVLRLVVVQFPLLNGGTAGTIWGYIILCLGSVSIYASMSEIASMSPTAGGQYHWVSEFAPPKYQKFLSFTTGLIKLNNPDYEMKAWHGTCLTIAIVIFAVAFNVLLATQLPIVETLILILHVCGLFLIIVPLWVLSPRNTSKRVWTQFDNGGSWSSMGTSVLVGIGGQVGTMCGYDCAIHMAEEIQDASRTLPKAIMFSVGINAILGFVMTLTLVYTTTNIEYVLDSPTGQPFMEMFFLCTKHVPTATAMSVLAVILLIFCAISELAAASRQVWSFARDGGMPGARFFSYIPNGWNIPLPAVVLTVLVTALISLLNIGSSTALQAFSSLTISSMFASYCLSIGCILRKRLVGEPLPPCRWSLGRFGTLINCLALGFTLPLMVFLFFPQTSMVDKESMNYAVVMFGGANILAGAYYFIRGKNHYVPPVVAMKRD